MFQKWTKRGFTLIELLVTIVIVAVLATLAVVSYTRYMRRAHTQEALNFLLEIKLKQEQYYSTYHQYASADVYPTDEYNQSNDYKPLLWSLDCINSPETTPGWCALGVRPAFSACPSDMPAGSQCSFHQYEVVAKPIDGEGEPGEFITNPARDWWYATGKSDLDRSGTQSEWFISSETTEVFNRKGDDI